MDGHIVILGSISAKILESVRLSPDGPILHSDAHLAGIILNEAMQEDCLITRH
jgi:hypothetical protein